MSINLTTNLKVQYRNVFNGEAVSETFPITLLIEKKGWDVSVKILAENSFGSFVIKSANLKQLEEVGGKAALKFKEEFQKYITEWVKRADLNVFIGDVIFTNENADEALSVWSVNLPAVMQSEIEAKAENKPAIIYDPVRGCYVDLNAPKRTSESRDDEWGTTHSSKTWL